MNPLSVSRTLDWIDTPEESSRGIIAQDRSTLEEIIDNAYQDSIVYVMDFSWKTVGKSIKLLGDSVPQQHGNGRYGYKFLSLGFTKWVQTSPDTSR